MRIRPTDPFRTSCRGLTYGEMMVVLAVFIILAGIFVLSSAEVMTKTRVSTAMGEEKMLADALVQYEAIQGNVPNETIGLTALEGSLIKNVPIDIFTKNSGRPQPYEYFYGISKQSRWMLVSVGPDGQPDVKNAIGAARSSQTALAGEGFLPSVFTTSGDLDHFITQFSYDPTNGTYSKGDVIRVFGQ